MFYISYSKKYKNQNTNSILTNKKMSFLNIFLVVVILLFFLVCPNYSNAEPANYSNIANNEDSLCLSKDPKATKFDTSIIYNLKAKDTECSLFKSLENPNKASEKLETSIFSKPCLLNTDKDSNFDTFRDNILGLDMTVVSGSIITINCKTNYSYINNERKTVSCNNGVLSFDFSGCKLNEEEISEDKICKSLPTPATIENGSVSFYLSTDNTKTPLTTTTEVKENESILSKLTCNSGYVANSTNVDYKFMCQNNGTYLKTQDGSVECYPMGNMPFHITVDISESEFTDFDLVFSPYNSGSQDCTINWGDGTSDKCPTSGGTINHNYKETGEYDLKITGKTFKGVHFRDAGWSKFSIKKLQSYGKWENNITSLEEAFSSVIGLSYINPNAFKYLQNVTSAKNLFFGCFIDTIPSGLFSNNKEITNFSSVFEGCSSLTSIPRDLFSNNLKVLDFSRAFYNTGLKCDDIDKGEIGSDYIVPDGIGDNQNWPRWNANGVDMTDAKFNCRY